MKVLVIETFERCYELEVPSDDKTTIQKAIDTNEVPLDEPTWVDTRVLDESGDEIFDY